MITRIVFLSLVLALLVSGSIGFLRHGRGVARRLLPIIAVGLALTGLGMMLAAAHYFPPLTDDPSAAILYALSMAAPLAVLCGFLAIALQRVLSPLGSINPVLPAAVLAMTLGASLMGLTGWHRLGNGLLDTSPARSKQGIVVEKQKDAVRVRWDNGQVQDIRISAEDAGPGSVLTVKIRQGYFDQPWISDVLTQAP